jgi:hypothetical protein
MKSELDSFSYLLDLCEGNIYLAYRICENYGGCRFTIPSKQHKRVVAEKALSEGKGIGEITQATGLHHRTIERITKELQGGKKPICEINRPIDLRRISRNRERFAETSSSNDEQDEVLYDESEQEFDEASEPVIADEVSEPASKLRALIIEAKNTGTFKKAAMVALLKQEIIDLGIGDISTATTLNILNLLYMKVDHLRARRKAAITPQKETERSIERLNKQKKGLSELREQTIKNYQFGQMFAPSRDPIADEELYNKRISAFETIDATIDESIYTEKFSDYRRESRSQTYDRAEYDEAVEKIAAELSVTSSLNPKRDARALLERVGESRPR